MRRLGLGKLWRRQRGTLLRVALIVTVPLLAVNLAVAFFGRTVVFPLSPFHLRDKVRALATYAAHRPRCLFIGHPPLGALVAATEARHHVPPGLLAALVEVESNGRVHRISPAGAMGPGQLTPGTAADLGVADPFDPPQALEGSARYLAEQLRNFRDLRLAVAAYNAGPGAIVGRRVPHNGETEQYVVKVLGAYAHLRPVVAQRPRAVGPGPVHGRRARAP